MHTVIVPILALLMIYRLHKLGPKLVGGKVHHTRLSTSEPACGCQSPISPKRASLSYLAALFLPASVCMPIMPPPSCFSKWRYLGIVEFSEVECDLGGGFGGLAGVGEGSGTYWLVEWQF